jgi:hypothetical protein
MACRNITHIHPVLHKNQAAFCLGAKRLRQ